MKDDIIRMIEEKKVMAIVRGVYGEDCLKLARALHEGGVDLLEVTFDQRSEEERELTVSTIKLLIKELGHCMAFGAGTVTTAEMVRQAKEAGALFIVAPNTDAAVIKETVKQGLVSIPGALTPTEIKQAWDLGADFVKVFPACNMGVSYFKNVSAPLSQVRLMAVGGVTGKDAKDYLAAGCSALGVAGCLFKKEWIKAGEWEKITEASRAFTSLLGV